MADVPVVWICGPPGVGKSTVGWQLFSRWAEQGRTVGYLDIDQLAMRQPADEQPGAATRTKAANLAAVLPNYVAAGAERIVVTGVATAAEVPLFEEAVGSIQWVRLSVDRPVLHRRFTTRDGPESMLPEVDRHADDLAASTFAALVIDTTNTTPAKTARQIDDANLLRGRPSVELTTLWAGAPSHPAEGHARVLLVTGPRTVGKSTVGWELLQRGHPEEPAAFIDLAQIGFVSAGTDLTVRDHRLRAANLTAMVGVYEQQGCRLVIAGGAVLSNEEREVYAAALAPTPLAVARLSATTEQLQQRIAARTALTGGPHLAGDDLRGRSDEAAEAVLRQAMEEAEELERSDFADHVLDTDGLSAAQAAERIHNFPPSTFP